MDFDINNTSNKYICRTDKSMNILTLALVCSFFICDLLQYGSIIIAGIAMTILAVYVFNRNGGIVFRNCALFKYMIVFALFSGASSFWALDKGYAIQQCITILEILVCIYIPYSHYSQYDSMEDLLRILLYSALIVTTYSIFYTGPRLIISMILYGERLILNFTSINMVALLDTYAIIIAIYFSVFKKKFIYLWSIPILLIIILASETRKSFIALAIGILLVIFLRNKSKSILKNIIIIIGIVYLSVIVYNLMLSVHLFEPIIQRIEIAINAFTGEGYVDSSTLQRSEMIDIGIEQFKETPFWGMGMGNPRLLLFGLWGKEYPYLHNNYVEILAGGGIVGLILYYIIYVHILLKVFTYRKVEWPAKYVIWIMTVIMITMDYMMVSYYLKITYFYLLILYIGIDSLSIRSRNSGQSINN